MGCLLVVAGYDDISPALRALTEEAVSRINVSPELADFFDGRFVGLGPRPARDGDRSAAVARLASRPHPARRTRRQALLRAPGGRPVGGSGSATSGRMRHASRGQQAADPVPWAGERRGPGSRARGAGPARRCRGKPVRRHPRRGDRGMASGGASPRSAAVRQGIAPGLHVRDGGRARASRSLASCRPPRGMTRMCGRGRRATSSARCPSTKACGITSPHYQHHWLRHHREPLK